MASAHSRKAGPRRKHRGTEGAIRYKSRIDTGADLTAHDRLHHSGDLLALGSVRLAQTDRDWQRARALEHHHVVLPRTAMGIRQGGRPVFVADPLHLTLHDPGVPYRREAIGNDDDHSDYLMLHPALAEELLGTPARFAAGQCGLDPPAFVAWWRLLRLAARRAAAEHPNVEPADSLALEEAALAWLSRFEVRDRRASGRTAAAGANRAVQRARRVLAESWRVPLSVSAIASAVHVSPFHLARRFRAETGLTLHGYRRALRARAALAEIEAHAGRLNALARTLGYVDLPHMSRELRQAFGVTPGEWARLGSG
jgi:AraC-like DNA-binding protein